MGWYRYPSRYTVTASVSSSNPLTCQLSKDPSSPLSLNTPRVLLLSKAATWAGSPPPPSYLWKCPKILLASCKNLLSGQSGRLGRVFTRVMELWGVIRLSSTFSARTLLAPMKRPQMLLRLGTDAFNNETHYAKWDQFCQQLPTPSKAKHPLHMNICIITWGDHDADDHHAYTTHIIAQYCEAP